jgi:hypothetical protein
MRTTTTPERKGAFGPLMTAGRDRGAQRERVVSTGAAARVRQPLHRQERHRAEAQLEHCDPRNDPTDTRQECNALQYRGGATGTTNGAVTRALRLALMLPHYLDRRMRPPPDRPYRAVPQRSLLT